MEMFVTTDAQTYADLCVYESINGERTLFSLFSHTETKRGREILLGWLLHPLNDPDKIRKRQEAVDWDALPDLPLTEEELDFIEYYLSYRDGLRPAHLLLSFAGTIDRFFKEDGKRYVISRGVLLVVRLIQSLDRLVKALPEDVPLLIKEFACLIEAKLSDTGLEIALQCKIDEDTTKLSDYETDKYDFLFRSVRLVTIQSLLSAVYQLDVCRTLHGIARERGFCCRPKMNSEGEFWLKSFVHPFVKRGVINNWQMDESFICVLTGSNMSGKSTTLKAVVQAVWLAHCGFPVPALDMSCPLFDGIYTSINLPDSLRDGRSHFLSEVMRIKEVLRHVRKGERCLAVMDEMFRGTNAQDAFESSVAVNNLLKQYPGSRFLISTHILEYAKVFENDPACCFYYMDSDIVDDCFLCSYRLMKGISEARFGAWIIRKELGV